MTEKITPLGGRLGRSERPVGEAINLDEVVRRVLPARMSRMRITKRSVRETECVEMVVETERIE